MPRSSDRFEWNGHSLCVTLYSYASTYFHTTTEIKPATTASGSKATLPWPLYFSDDPRREGERVCLAASLFRDVDSPRASFKGIEIRQRENQGKGSPINAPVRLIRGWKENNEGESRVFLPSFAYSARAFFAYTYTHTQAHTMCMYIELSTFYPYTCFQYKVELRVSVEITSFINRRDTKLISSLEIRTRSVSITFDFHARQLFHYFGNGWQWKKVLPLVAKEERQLLCPNKNTCFRLKKKRKIKKLRPFFFFFLFTFTDDSISPVA